LPVQAVFSFRPQLRLMWPAGSMTANVGWDAAAHAYTLGEESRKLAALIGSPSARDVSVMPYQEEPRDVPVQFVVEVPRSAAREVTPVVIVGGVEGLEAARKTYARVLGSVGELRERTAAHYRRLGETSAAISTPDARLDRAFSWAVVGTDKGLATNPLLGTGLLAGFRTSGASERPGFAWFFGRDALWTSLALNSYGDLEASRTALEFLRKFQRQDGKIPHEISQSASLIPWFTDYPYAWASADATPLYLIGHADYWNSSGDRAFLASSWDSILRAYRFSAATDTDANGLIENTGVGHGWVEGGALYPAHEEVYMQGLWIHATRGLAELAAVMGDAAIAREARDGSERTRVATEKTYWRSGTRYYAFATGPGGRLIDEDTVLPAVPLWWGALDERNAQFQLDHLGAGVIATDWGARILSNESKLYDPLSYHYGSVWPLFTGWSSMAAYRYGRPQVGYQALMANANLTETGALGYVTELLSGDFHSAFGRSSHHQIWSEAMVVTPIVRGLFGISIGKGGTELAFAPQIPANWDRASIKGVRAGSDRFDLNVQRTPDALRVAVTRTSTDAPSVTRLVVAPAFPLDAQVRSVTVNGRGVSPPMTAIGDVQKAEVVIDRPQAESDVVFARTEGSDVWREIDPPKPGARNEGLRVLRSLATRDALMLTVEGLGGRSYTVYLHSPRRVGAVAAEGVRVEGSQQGDPALQLTFKGPEGKYVRRQIAVPLGPR
jgi:glycogen debranching enzyme